MYDSVNKCFDIHGYKYSLPSIGVENSLTDFLISKYYDTDSYKYNGIYIKTPLIRVVFLRVMF